MAKPIANSMLVLRIFTLAASAASIGLIVTNNITFSVDNSKRFFKDVIAYRFVLAVAAITAAYILIQLPFAIYYAVKEKRMIRGGYLREFDFYGDKVISLLLASGVAAGFAVSIELKRFFDELFDQFQVPKDDVTRSTNDNFFDRGYIATGVLTVGLICMVVCSVLSSVNRNKGFFG
ncbi:CASP-like protein [Quillaja saponaria]|uniref:CASP-like protein n=1 Tax=Quillaja saponaria TaxID=32244 RepID=A0AAD7Q5P8_QUISA|nr:CASP-like protein [Quillaja saponaria]